ncbi:MAG: hypothetical protein JMM76_02600 [Candidatus Xiphinematobacter sp.]|nr:MAG: hypothetical protein JMM76_02600 [Candidatus Xiphinematobacter sp.]
MSTVITLLRHVKRALPSETIREGISILMETAARLMEQACLGTISAHSPSLSGIIQEACRDSAEDSP